MGKSLYTPSEVKEFLEMGLSIEDIKGMVASAGASEEQAAAVEIEEKQEVKKEKKQRFHPITGKPLDKNGKTINPERDGMHYVEPFKMDEVKKVYEAMKTDRDKLYVIVSVYTAFRVSDLVDLTFGDLREEKVVVVEKKTGKTRKVLINDRVKKELEKWEHKEDHELCFESRQGSGKAISRQQAHNIVIDAAVRAGIIKRAKPEKGKRKGKILGNKHYGTHSLRKAFGRHQYEKGTPLVGIMRHYNHSSVNVTMVYLGIDEEDMDAISASTDFGF